MATMRELVLGGASVPSAISIVGQTDTTLTAAGSTQATALQLNRAINNVTTTAASTGVILPLGPQTSDRVHVRNSGANSLSVYPPVGGNINAAGANAAFALAAGKSADFVYFDNGVTIGALLSA
jgi:hypothetical protein